MRTISSLHLDLHRHHSGDTPARPRGLHVVTGLVLTAALLAAGCSAGDSSGGRASSAIPTDPTSDQVSSFASPGAAAGTGTGRAIGIRTSRQGRAQTCIQTAFSQLSATQRAAQLVMAGVPVGSPGGQAALVKKNHLGGVFLAGRSSHSPATVRKSVALLPAQKTANATIKLLVSTDQEGGQVQTLRGGSWTTIPAATVQATWSKATLKSRTTAWVKQLKSAGITMDLAPVADTVPAGTEAKNPPIGYYHRQYGSTPAAVASKITTVTSSMRAAGVIPTVKHFPGLGRVRYNTDTSTHAVDNKTTTTDPYLDPFQAGITAGAGAVMVSSASYPKLDPDHLAVFSSKVITDLLRTKLGYQGVVMTDDVGRAVAVKSVATGQRAVRFITAGGDVVLTVVSSQAPTMVSAIVAKARSSASFRAKVNASALRVLELKYAQGLLTCQ